MLPADPFWYKDAIIYELHVKAFFDGNDDGIGDFPGLIRKLDYLQDLGVTCLWLLPFYPSPLRDDGYDIADYHGVHPSYGTRKHVVQFVREAHERGLRIITELVINHTSDAHPWFQAARQAPPGSSKRDFYVWSETNTRYPNARIIFSDSETSNWSWDPVAKAYYWHRFFHHQPDLNFDNPVVLRAVVKAMRFWLDMGVDGMRLDAIPYLIERDGTNCENLSESHDVIKKIRREMDRHYHDKMLLAEANQWPADVLPYFGDGDECHMAFHFPLMPRIFMAIRQEDRHPIVEIMRQTPDIPPDCQWAIFLRNHDELTLEMVTDEERDYMYREYAADPRMRLNLGIRRRLAPLANNSRLRIELLNSLLLSMPGTPVIYYGDEIGMGDNIYLGDRNGVRTPMQWTGDRNAGFSRADFARLFTAPIMDPVYGYQAINVEAQQREPSSLLQWMKRTIALRKRFRAFGRGSIEFLNPRNRQVLAYVRSHEDEQILCVANLSRFVQPFELDLPMFRGFTPVELFGRIRFPVVGETPYFLSLGPHSFFWFRMERAAPSLAGPAEPTPESESGGAPALVLTGGWETLMEGKHRAVLERTILPRHLKSQRWFGSKSGSVETISIRDWVPLVHDPAPAFLVRIRAYTSDGRHDRYLVPLALITGLESERFILSRPRDALALVTSPAGVAILVDAMADDRFCLRLLELIGRGLEVRTQAGRLRGVATAAYAELGESTAPAVVKRGSVEQSNTTITYDDRLILKLFRRLEPGTNPDFEIGRFFTERTDFRRVPRTAGALEFHRARGEPTTFAVIQELVPNQGQGWEWVLKVLKRYYDEVAGETHRLERIRTPRLPVFQLSELTPPDDVFQVVGTALRSAAVLGRRTGEMHLALSSSTDDPSFTAEPLTLQDLQAIEQRVRAQARAVFELLARRLDSFDPPLRTLATKVLLDAPALAARVCDLAGFDTPLVKIRCHGDYHLGQVLWQETDFIILDFEGEPGRPLADRRARQSPLKDVAGMLRSFDYAVQSALLHEAREAPDAFDRLQPWALIWRAWTSAAFLREYRAVAGAALLPGDTALAGRLLDLFVLEKLLFELRYELDYRPDWVSVPLLGLRQLIEPAGLGEPPDPDDEDHRTGPELH